MESVGKMLTENLRYANPTNYVTAPLGHTETISFPKYMTTRMGHNYKKMIWYIVRAEDFYTNVIGLHIVFLHTGSLNKVLYQSPKETKRKKKIK